MATIRNIRIYRSTIENIDGNSHPEGFYNQELSCVVFRICMKLREKNFSMGDFHHLYINFTTCKDTGTICLADRSIDKYQPWYRYYDIGISQETYDSLLTKECIPTVIELLEKTLKTQFDTHEFGEALISECIYLTLIPTFLKYEVKSSAIFLVRVVTSILSPFSVLSFIWLIRSSI